MAEFGNRLPFPPGQESNFTTGYLTGSQGERNE